MFLEKNYLTFYRAPFSEALDYIPVDPSSLNMPLLLTLHKWLSKPTLPRGSHGGLFFQPSRAFSTKLKLNGWAAKKQKFCGVF